MRSANEVEGLPHEKRNQRCSITCKSPVHQGNYLHVQHACCSMSKHCWKTSGNTARCKRVKHCRVTGLHHDNGSRKKKRTKGSKPLTDDELFGMLDNMGLVRGSDKAMQETGELELRKATAITKFQV